jgi:hypothetical protein
MQIEKDGHAFHRRALEQSADLRAKAMPKCLIGEEEGHLIILWTEHDYCPRLGSGSTLNSSVPAKAREQVPNREDANQ